MLSRQWRHVSKLAGVNRISLGALVARPVTAALVDKPHPPPATVRTMVSLLLEIFRAHRRVPGVAQGAVTAPALRAILGGHFSALSELLFDLVMTVAAADDESWREFVGGTLCEVVRGSILSAESAAAFAESAAALLATPPGDPRRRELVELCCCLAG